MNITNKFNLPKTILNAIERDPYDKGAARMSVTGLLSPPRIGLLRKKHGPDITADASDYIWSLMGRAVHTVLEQGGDEEHITEERLFTDVRGWRISGAIDLQKVRDGVVRLTDYKTCSAYAVLHEKPDWQNQLNLYGHLCRLVKGWEVESLHVCAIIRDWSRHKAKEDMDYPGSPVVMIPIPLWPHEAAQKFLEERVKVHQEAIATWDMGGESPPCTDNERWMRPPSWAVKKKGNKRPTRIYDNPKDAENFMAVKADPDYVVDHRPGEPIRCTGNYCQVAPWCRQFAEWEKENKK